MGREPIVQIVKRKDTKISVNGIRQKKRQRKKRTWLSSREGERNEEEEGKEERGEEGWGECWGDGAYYKYVRAENVRLL